MDPADPAAIAAAIDRLIDDAPLVQAMGQAGRSAVLSHYHWPMAEAELLALYRVLLA